MLVHHADAEPDGVARAGDVDGLPVDHDLARVGVNQAVQDVHKGRLARAVLAHKGMDLAMADAEVDVIVGEHARKLLGDAAHVDRERTGLAHSEPGT